MRWLARIGIAIVILTIGLGAYWGSLGYFGGQLYVPIMARAAPASNETGLAAVVISGDMGFDIGMGRKIGDRLAADGIPVIGVNSLVYFHERRTPAEVRSLIREAMWRALSFGHAKRVVLIGQSYGADMVHVGLIDLPPELRKRLAMVALMVPTDTVMFRASPAETLNLVPADAAAIDTGKRLDWVPVLCVRGAEEQDSLCPLLHMPNVRKVVMPGGHPLHRDADGAYAHLAEAIDTIALKDGAR